MLNIKNRIQFFTRRSFSAAMSALTIFLSLQAPLNVQVAGADQELLFNTIAWGTDYDTAAGKLASLSLLGITGGDAGQYSAMEIATGDDDQVDFDNPGINMVCSAYNGKVDIGGYKTTAIHTYFSYLPVDGEITGQQSDTALYAARYEFEDVEDLEKMTKDLTKQLSKLYGKPSDTEETKSEDGISKTCVSWQGANDTMIVLRGEDSDTEQDNLYISYIWLGGDDLLKEADQAAAGSPENEE